jgi:Ca2+-binding RTX toxin-like protein
VITTLATYALTADVERLTSSPDSVVGHDFRGNSIDNVVTGNSRNDLFRLQDGGNDAVYGLAGRDVLYFGAAFTPGDHVDAGADSDSLVLQGDYSAGITFGTGTTTNIVGVESISLMSGTNAAFGDSAGRLYDYDLTMLDGNVAAGGTIKINGAQLLAGEDLRFNGSAETDGFYLVYGGKGVDTFTGGAQADVFVFSHDGRFGAGDKVDGGGGYDVVYLRGDYTIDFNDAGFEGAFANVESLHLQSAFDTSYAGGGDGELDYNLIWDDGLLPGGATMTINGGKLTENESLSFDGSQETNGHFRIFGGAGDDVLRGGSGNDLIYGALGADTMTGGAGSDVFRYQTAADSTVNGRDGIGDFSSEDMIDLQRVDANILVAGDQAFTFIGSAGFNGRAGELQAVANGGGIWTISGDVDGNGQADFQFVVTTVGGHVIGADDFLL